MIRKTSLALLLATALLVGCATSKKGNSTAAQQPSAALNGGWILDLIPYPSAAFDSLYSDRKPELSFETASNRFSGYTGCNRINGPLVSKGNTINFRGDIAMTKMACPGDGESVFMENLKKINKYAVSADGKELTLIQGDIALMRFHRK